MNVRIVFGCLGEGNLAHRMGLDEKELSMDAVSIGDVIHQVVSMSQIEAPEWWLSRMFNEQNRLTRTVRIQLNDESHPFKEYDLDAMLRDGDVIYLAIGR